MGSLAIIWKANRNCTRGTPVRWPPGLRLRDSWWGREETQTLCGRALAAAQPISYMYARSIPLPFFPPPSSSPPPRPATPLRTAQRRHGARGSRRGWGGGEKSVVAMETTGREEVGLCAGRGWGGWRGAQCQLGNSLCGRCTCTALCMASFRKCGACIT